MVTTAQLRRMGFNAGTGRKPEPARRARGTGAYSVAKASKTARHPMALELLGVNVLPAGVEVKPTEGTPNKWESEYLKTMRMMGPAMFQPVMLRLCEGARYTPDIVARVDGVVYCVETKGLLREAARLRYLMAREKYPQFKFSMVRKVGGKWETVKLKGVK